MAPGISSIRQQPATQWLHVTLERI